jgi:hypothetical protein
MDAKIAKTLEMVQSRYLQSLTTHDMRVTKDNCEDELGIGYRTWRDLVNVYRNCAAPFGFDLNVFAQAEWDGVLTKLKTLACRMPPDPDYGMWWYLRYVQNELTVKDTIAIGKLCDDLEVDLETLVDTLGRTKITQMVRDPNTELYGAHEAWSSAREPDLFTLRRLRISDLIVTAGGIENMPHFELLLRSKKFVMSRLKFGQLMVGRRKTGELHVVDGSKRLYAAYFVGWQFVPALVFKSSGAHQEGQLRSYWNTRIQSEIPMDDRRRLESKEILDA